MTASHREPLGPMPAGRSMAVVDETIVRAGLLTIFALAAHVEEWPGHLSHYRYVRYRERDPNGDGVVEMSANRPFGPIGWPTWWLSEMRVLRPVDGSMPSIRFRHIGGITTGMDVEWRFAEVARGTQVRIVHVWDGPRWPIIGEIAATMVIGPVFVHGIASRTLEGLAHVAERRNG